MARDVLITPASGLIDFLDTAVSKATITLGTDGILVLTGGANPIVIETSTAGSSALKVDGTNGTLFEVVDDLSGSLMSVNDAAGLPIFEVFADNHIVAGRYGQNDFYLDTNGRLGLGITSPITTLNVKGDQSANGQLYIEPTNDSEYAGLVIKSTRSADREYAIFVGGTGTDDLNFRFRDKTAGADRMVIDTSGFVGIGTVTPTGLVHISDNNTSPTPNPSANQLVISNNTTGGISILHTNDTSSGYILFGDTSSTSSGQIRYLHTTDSLSLATAGTERVFIDSSGFMGIGLSPSQRLHINGNFLMENNTEIRQKSTGGTQHTIIELDNNNDLNIGGSYAGALRFIGGGSYSEVMRIHDDGKIGIGTTTPGSAVDIEGDPGALTSPLLTVEKTGSYIDKDTIQEVLRLVGKSSNENAVGVPSAGTALTFYNRWSGGTAYSVGRIVGRGYQGYNGGLQFDVADNTGAGQSNFTAAMTISDSAYVGIGTTGPSFKLDINGDTNIRGNATTSSYKLWFSDTGAAEWYINYGNGGLQFVENGVGTNVFFEDGGNVGINTVSPSEKFRVNGTFSSNAFWTNSSAISYWGNYSTAYGGLTWGSGYARVFANTGNKLELAANSSTLGITVATDGNVGVKTNAPSYPIHVTGDGYVSGALRVCNSWISSSYYNYSSGYLVNTGILQSSNRMFDLTIEVNGYSVDIPGLIRIQGYNYTTSGTIIQFKAQTTHQIGTIYAFHYNSYVYIWFEQTGSYETYTFKINVSTGSPDSKLQVSNAVKPTTGVTNETTATTVFIPSSAGGSAGHLAYWSSNNGLTYSSDGNLYWDETNNRLGIGSAGPNVSLDVVGGIRSSAQVDASPNSGAFRLYDGTTMRGGLGTDAWALGTGINTDLTLIVSGANNLHFATNNTKRVTIDSGGNVGIGTTTPNYTLENEGTTDFGDTTTWNNAAAGLISWNAGTKFKVKGQSGHALSLGAGGTEDYVYITTSGNVGIGTTDIESWGSAYDAIEFYRSAITAGTSSSELTLWSNAYNDGVSTKYKSGSQAARYYLSSAGTHVFQVAPTGTADTAISWTSALTINNDGSLSVSSTTLVDNLNADMLDGTELVDVRQKIEAASASGLDLNSIADGWYRWAFTVPTNGPSGSSYMLMLQENDGSQDIQIAFGGSSYGKIFVRRRDNGTFYNWTEFWSDQNDGAGSGLDADLLDGQQGSYYTTATNIGGLTNNRIVLTDSSGNLTTCSTATWSTTNGGAFGLGGSVSSNVRLQVSSQNPVISANSTNYYKALYAAGQGMYNIATGVTDSGYRIALDASSFVSDSDFLGTLSSQYAVWARHGANVSGAGSIITNSYGVYIDSLTTANTCINNLWGIYQNASAAKNFFSGSVGIGTTSDAAGKLTVVQSSNTSTGGFTLYDSATSSTFRIWRDGFGAGSVVSFDDRGVSNIKLKDGNVGIGAVPSSSYQLHVTHPSSGAAVLGLTGVGGSKDTWSINSTDLSGSAVLTFRDEDTSTTVMTLKQNGDSLFGARVAIKTTTLATSNQLHVSSGTTGSANENSIAVVSVADNSTFNTTTAALHVVNSGNRGTKGHASGSDLLRLAFSDALHTVFDKDGQVGIGGTPTSTLHVHHTGHTDGINWTRSGVTGAVGITGNYVTLGDTGNARQAIRIDTGSYYSSGAVALDICATGSIKLNSPIDTWNYVGADGINFARETEFGYNSIYKVLQLGTSTNCRAIAIGVDVSANASGSFNGNEIVLPIDRNIIAPNNTNNSYYGLLGLSTSHILNVGGSTYNVKGGGHIRIDLSGGLVGIGQTPTTYKLEVNGDILAAASNVYVSNGGSASGSSMYSPAANELAFSTNSTEAIRIDSSQYVGINENDPSGRLHVKDTSNLYTYWESNPSGVNSAVASFYGVWNGTNVALISMRSGSDTVNKDNGDITFYTSTSGGTLVRAMTIDENQRVSIGTRLDPQASLHIDTASNSAADIILEANRTAANTAVGQLIGYWDGTSVAKIALKTGDDTVNKDDGEIAFEVAAAGTTVEAMRIDKDGKIGINTVSPSQRFSVSETLTYNDSTRLLTVVNSGNAGGLEITGANGRIYFNGYRAIEGNTSGSILAIAEGYSCANVLAHLLVTQSSTSIRGGFGAITTGGTLDWNDSTNARSGNGHTLLRGNATNGPSGGSEYYHPFSFEYTSKDGSGNMTQFAIPYSSGDFYMRYRYSSSWSSWYTIWTSYNDGAGSGLHADCLDGQQGSYYDQSGCSGLNCVGTVTNVTSCNTSLLTISNGTTTPGLTIQTAAVADGGASLATGDQIHTFVTGLGYTTNTGTVTSVGLTAGNLIDITGTNPITTSGTMTLHVDLSELTTSVADGDGDYFVVVDSVNAQKKLTKANINLSGFNNDSGFTTNTGTVTSVASGTGLTGGPITGSGTLSLANSGVTPGTYGNACIAVDTYGRITSVCSGDSGTVTSVSSGTTNQLTVTNGTTTPTLSIQTAAVADLGTALATGDQIYDFVIGQGYCTSNNYLQSASFCDLDGTLTFVRSGLSNVTVNLDGRYCTSDTNNYVTGASFGTVTDGVLTLTRSGLTDVTVDLDGRYCFDNDYLTSGSFSSATGNLTLVSTGTVSDVVVSLDGRYCTSDTNNYVSTASFNTSDGVLTLTRSGLTNVSVDLDGRYELTKVWGACLQNDTGTINHSTVAAGALTCTASSGCAITGLTTDSYGHVTGATIGCTTSDYRAKTNIQNYDIGYEAVKSVPTYSYTLKKEKEKGTQVGMMAHELQEAGVCFGVYGKKDEMDENGQPKYQHVSYDQLVPTLWDALRKSICKIEILENKICKLESCVTILGQCVIE